MLRNERFLLDTHIWVWLLNGDSRIKQSPLFSRIARAGNQSGLYVSAISIWEIAMLEKKGRIVFSTEITAWIEDALTAPGLQIVQLLPQISIDSTRLPGLFHGDPADRIIVATARFLNCPLITMDEKIIAYAAGGHLEAVSL
jgi:PIN domain nuclease of toxin-antitoxin system